MPAASAHANVAIQARGAARMINTAPSGRATNPSDVSFEPHAAAEINPTNSPLRTGVILYNGVNESAGSASLAYHQPMEAGQSVTLVLEYWANPRGQVPPPTITSSVAPPPPGANSLSGAADDVAPAFAINRSLKMPDGAFLIEFTAEAGKYYRVEYCDHDLVWKSCPVPICAGGTKVHGAVFAKNLAIAGDLEISYSEVVPTEECTPEETPDPQVEAPR